MRGGEEDARSDPEKAGHEAEDRRGEKTPNGAGGLQRGKDLLKSLFLFDIFQIFCFIKLLLLKHNYFL